MKRTGKVVLITGVFGQDGSYLSELLAGKGYEVHGVVRKTLSEHSWTIRKQLEGKEIRPVVHACDLNTYEEVRNLLLMLKPDECYHLAATHYSAQTVGEQALRVDRGLFHDNVLSILNLLNAIREVSPATRLVSAGSCLMYDGANVSPQNEAVPYRSNSIYGLSKLTGSLLVSLFRTSHQLYASTAILYNHESPRRPDHFVSKKIVKNLLKLANKKTDHFTLGNLRSVKDWGYARDYVLGMWLMGQQDAPRDYILATGEGHTVGDFAQHAAEIIKMPEWRDYLRLDEGLTREPVRTPLIGDPTLARRDLGWHPSVNFEGLVELMVRNESCGKLD